MMRATFLGVAAACLGLAAITGNARQAAAADLAVKATPVGIQIVALGNSKGSDGVSNVLGYRYLRTRMALADALGRTLYTHDKDQDGKPTCVGDCAQKWRPADAPAAVAIFGDWSAVPRNGGGSQWAYKGKPLYVFADDKEVGDSKGEGQSDGAWHAANFQPTLGQNYPAGIFVQEVGDANGYALVDHLGRTIYAYEGKLKDDGTACSKELCETPWSPVAAPSLALPMGDFTIVMRADGTQQWAFKGRPLYLSKRDVAANQVNGQGVDRRWSVALVVAYPVPPGVTVQQTLASGLTLATAGGHSLYRQHLYYYSTAGHDYQHGHAYTPHYGRALGAHGCVDECLKSWRPFLAPADAQPVGYWSVVTRDDGTKQWAYKEYALYTYVGDKKPGDLLGINTWDVSINDPALHMESLFKKTGINAEIMSGVVFTSAYP